MGVTARLFVLLLAVNLLILSDCNNKYSAESNADTIDLRPNSLKDLGKPFRMAKLNMLWAKAKIVSYLNYLFTL